MKVPKIFTALAAAILLTSANVSAEAIDFADGVDWQRRVITVTGEGIVPPDAVNYTQAKGLASKAAKADAYRKLGEIINGVRVEGETTVEKMLTTYDQIKVKVEATIKGAKVLNETFLSDGGYRVTVQVPLFGTTNSLAGAVFEKNSAVEPFPNPVTEIEPSLVPYSSSTPVKQRLEFARRGTTTAPQNFESVPTTPYRSPLSRMSLQSFDSIILQNVQMNSLTIQEPTYIQPTPATQMPYDAPTTQRPARRTVAEYASMARGDYTGLIVDCRGLGLQPVMSAVIKNTNGTKIYGHKNLDIDRIIREGLADYISDEESVGRAGENPLVVRAVAVEDFNSNPVLAIPDSNRVLIENYASKFLKDMKVVFLFDSFEY
ncbi:MAG: LPP20 family lipoprotein [Selenomonadaceae bacterium]|nr:LPP20 family lipoprotein [Selenomonadaceae bacterium]MBQ9496019.1 LPP20 family lipoprotein [Selenomonadaceae bacterium]